MPSPWWKPTWGNLKKPFALMKPRLPWLPLHFSPWKEIGYLYSQSNKYEEALAAFKKAIERNPNDSLSWNGLGDVYHKLGRSEDAISAYQLGNVFDRPVRSNEALTVIHRSSNTEEENPRVLEEMGNINFANGAFEDAVTAYANAIELLEDTTDKARLWTRLGETYQQLNKNDEADSAFKKAAELDAENTAAHDNGARMEPTPASVPANGIEENCRCDP